MSAPSDRPNILIVVLDAARRDALEPYGAAPGSTPAIAQLASRGRALEQVRATGCWTAPSHASLFTGLMPRAAGLSRVPSPSASRPLMEAHRKRTLAHVFARAGYDTRAVSANLWVSEPSGFATGFGEFVTVDTGRHARVHAAGARERARWLLEAVRARVDDGAAETERVIAGWIGEARERPFLWFTNVIECHSPYLPPRGYGDVSLVDRLLAAEDARRHYTLEAIWRACAGGHEIPPRTIERLRKMYAASIRYMDDWLARLLERLDAARLLDDTLVVVTSDHGENFGEGGLVSHGLSLDERLIHIPLVAAGPGSGTLELASTANLPRALADAAGLTDHPWTDGPPEGVGVAQFDAPADAEDPRVVEWFTRWGLGDEARRHFSEPLTCAVADGLKLLRRGEREEVYDLAADPLEANPIAASELEPSRTGALDSLRRSLGHPSVAAVRDQDVEREASAPSAAEVGEIEERMRLLGYM